MPVVYSFFFFLVIFFKKPSYDEIENLTRVLSSEVAGQTLSGVGLGSVEV